MYSFDKTRRLLQKSDYDRVFAKSKKVVSSRWVVLYRDNTCGHARLGLAISKKMIAKAHHRNRVKRLLRETFRQTHLPSVDIVVLARSGTKDDIKTMNSGKLSTLWDKLIASYNS